MWVFQMRSLTDSMYCTANTLLRSNTLMVGSRMHYCSSTWPQLLLGYGSPNCRLAVLATTFVYPKVVTHRMWLLVGCKDCFRSHDLFCTVHSIGLWFTKLNLSNCSHEKKIFTVFCQSMLSLTQKLLMVLFRKWEINISCSCQSSDSSLIEERNRYWTQNELN